MARKTKRQLAEAAQEQMGHPVPAVAEVAPAKAKGRKRAQPAPDVLATSLDDLPEGVSHPEVLGRGFLCRATGQLTDGVWTDHDRPGLCNVCTHCR
jgi:hypothetical protein